MSLRRGLAQSRNVPAIKAYYLAGGKDPIVDLAEKMGITTLSHQIEYGWPLALGTGEVTLTELVQAFSVFAREGNKIELNPFLRIENQKGDKKRWIWIIAVSASKTPLLSPPYSRLLELPYNSLTYGMAVRNMAGSAVIRPQNSKPLDLI